MDFEEWWWPRKPLGDELISGDVVTTAARAAWGARDAEINELKKANSSLAEAAIVPEGYVLVPVDSIEKAIQSAVLEFGRPNITATSVKRFAIEYAKRIKEPSDA
jgi:hypothetical protein